MPICEADPWRMQYFEHVACPADVLISTEDADSWVWYPRRRWIYDKVTVALSQGLEIVLHLQQRLASLALVHDRVQRIRCSAFLVDTLKPGSIRHGHL